MENLVDMIEKILEKSNRIQQGFLDRLEANDLRLGRIEGRISSIENKLADLYANHNNQLVQIEAAARLSSANSGDQLRAIDGIADRLKLVEGLVENVEDKLIDMS